MGTCGDSDGHVGDSCDEDGQQGSFRDRRLRVLMLEKTRDSYLLSDKLPFKSWVILYKTNRETNVRNMASIDHDDKVPLLCFGLPGW